MFLPFELIQVAYNLVKKSINEETFAQQLPSGAVWTVSDVPCADILLIVFVATMRASAIDAILSQIFMHVCSTLSLKSKRHEVI